MAERLLSCLYNPRYLYFHVYILPSSLPIQCGGRPLPDRGGPLSGGGAIPHHHTAGSHISSVEGSAHPVSLIVPLPSILSHLSWAGGDGLVGYLLYWLLTTRLEAACYLNWTHSSRESQMQGSAVGEWMVDSWGRGGAAYMCIVCFCVSECVCGRVLMYTWVCPCVYVCLCKGYQLGTWWFCGLGYYNILDISLLFLSRKHIVFSLSLFFFFFFFLGGGGLCFTMHCHKI